MRRSTRRPPTSSCSTCATRPPSRTSSCCARDRTRGRSRRSPTRRGGAAGRQGAAVARRGLRPRRVDPDGLLHVHRPRLHAADAPFYSLERLWGDAERIEVSDEPPGTTKRNAPANHVCCARVADGLLAVLLAPACAACERPLEQPTRGPVCAACWNAIVPITPPLCDRCGDPLPSWRALRRRATVPAVPAPSVVATAAAPSAPYDGTAARDRARAQVRRTAVRWPPVWECDCARAAGDLLAAADVVVPVPLHRPGGARAASTRRARSRASWRPRTSTRCAAFARRRRRPIFPADARHANVRGAFAQRWRPRRSSRACESSSSTT